MIKIQSNGTSIMIQSFFDTIQIQENSYICCKDLRNKKKNLSSTLDRLKLYKQKQPVELVRKQKPTGKIHKKKILYL